MLPYHDKEKCASPFLLSAHSGIVLLLFLSIYIKLGRQVPLFCASICIIVVDHPFKIKF